MVTAAGRETNDDPYASPSTWREWMRFVDTDPPCLPGTGPWSAEDRLDYHSRFVILSTPTMTKVSLTLRRLMILNRRHNGTARRGLLISGPPTTGKTTTLQQLGRSFHLADRARRGAPDNHMPVVFLSVPPAATAKMLVSELARFLDLPLTASMNQAHITDIVCATLNELGTRLVLIDDVHLLNTRTRNGAETSDQMKHLSERIPATFVYAGVALDSSPLLTGVRGAQIAGRFKTVRNPPLGHGSPAQRASWEGLIQGMDEALRLDAHRTGALARHAPYLHLRTGGRIGSLSALVREAAIAAILDGSEKITKALLDDIELDELAEHTPRHARRR
ncbi:TniB family NTP-binding protein [Streptomyces sp. NPDC048269]|uniref:TniB family NTP-binding protein n=1 Tax=Streptomyces sp. NPDC048269 TaxID=3155753 RepID=UPI00342DA9FC